MRTHIDDTINLAKVALCFFYLDEAILSPPDHTRSALTDPSIVEDCHANAPLPLLCALGD